MTRLEAGRKGVEAAMLGPSSFPFTTPTDEKGKKTAWAVAWSALVMGVVMMLLSVMLPA